jgi:hypothetical protein
MSVTAGLNDRGKKREGRAQLTGEMMDAKVGPVRAESFGGDGQVAGLKQCVARRPHL